MATTTIFNYELKVDRIAQIKSDQSNAIARDYLRSFLKQLEHAGVIGGPAVQAMLAQDSIHQDSKALSKATSKMSQRESINSALTVQKRSSATTQRPKKRYRGLTELEYMQSAYNDDSIKGMLSLKQERNGSVLASKESMLVAVIFDPVEFVLYSVGSNLMIR